MVSMENITFIRTISANYRFNIRLVKQNVTFCIKMLKDVFVLVAFPSHSHFFFNSNYSEPDAQHKIENVYK